MRLVCNGRLAMSRMSRPASLLLVLSVLAFALSACGNKGPLVLPDKPQDKEKKKDSPASATAPAATSADAAKKQ